MPGSLARHPCHLRNAYPKIEHGDRTMLRSECQGTCPAMKSSQYPLGMPAGSASEDPGSACNGAGAGKSGPAVGTPTEGE